MSACPTRSKHAVNMPKLHCVGRIILALAALLPVTQCAIAQVVVNGVVVAEELLSRLRPVMGTPPAGSYWYDARTGAYGLAGQATAGWIPPALPLPGALRADASGGGDGRFGGVFINGRELHPLDVAALAASIGNVIPGRYWVDADGNFGAEGGAPIGNLLALARARGGDAGGPRGSKPSGCYGAGCESQRSWLGQDYFSDGKSGCIVMQGEISC